MATSDKEARARELRAAAARTSVAKGLVLDATLCKYRAVPAAAESLGWSVSTAQDDQKKSPTTEWHLFWTDLSVSHQRVAALRPLQKLNHFADMTSVCNKATCASVIKRVSRQFPHEYRFYPRSWQLPKEAAALRKLMLAGEAPSALIVKPNRGCQGVDISICTTSEELDATRQQMGQQCVAQDYVDKPLLLDGYKFDLRLYVCVTSCAPLRVHLYREGIARLCTEKYGAPTAGGKPMAAPVSDKSRAYDPKVAESDGSGGGGSARARPTSAAQARKGAASSATSGSGSARGSSSSSSAAAPASSSSETAATAGTDATNGGGSISGGGGGGGSGKPPPPPKATAAAAAADWRFRHLTNYAINKAHPDFVAGGEDSSKRLLTQVLDQLAHEGVDVDLLWGEVQQLVVKTIIAVQPHLSHSYSSCRPATDAHPFSCFELLGLDLLLDEQARLLLTASDCF